MNFGDDPLTTLGSFSKENFKIKSQKAFCKIVLKLFEVFHDEGPYHIETSPLTSSTNKWTDFYLITTSVMKEFELRGPTFWKICCYKRLQS